jgi:hypothetical protein
MTGQLCLRHRQRVGRQLARQLVTYCTAEGDLVAEAYTTSEATLGRGGRPRPVGGPGGVVAITVRPIRVQGELIDLPGKVTDVRPAREPSGLLRLHDQRAFLGASQVVDARRTSAATATRSMTSAGAKLLSLTRRCAPIAPRK